MITNRWNSQRRASITQQDPGHVEDAMKKMNPGGWNRQREASNIQQLFPCCTLQEDIIISVGNIQEEHQESPNNTHEKSCQEDYITWCSV